MLVKISLVIALCSGVKYADIQKRMSDLISQNPGSQVSVRIDKKAACYDGKVLTGKDAKLIEALGQKI